MSQTALIIHELMDMPQNFKERGDGTISNGYYLVALDGSRFGMGSASYQADTAQMESLRKAVEFWKLETGWTPPVSVHDDAPEEQSGRRIVSPDVFVRSAYETFAKSIRSHHKSFLVHKDSTVLSSGLQNAIIALDSILKPVEAIEGKRASGPDGNTSSA